MRLNVLQAVALLALMGIILTLPWTYDYVSKAVIIIVLLLAMFKLLIEVMKG